MLHRATPRAHHGVRFLVGLASLVLPSALLAGCEGGHDGDAESLLPAEADAAPNARPTGSSALTTYDPSAACPGFGVSISVDGNDVQLDWSQTAPEGHSVTLFRSLDPNVLLDVESGAPVPGVERIVLQPDATHHIDVGAADQNDQTPTYYYRLAVEADNGWAISTMVMKTSTAMAPGYNKFGACMLGGPTRASDVVAQLGDSVVGVWGWDATSQTYLNWTPAHGVGTDADFAIPFGGLFAAQVDGSTPSYQSLVGVVPKGEAFEVSGEPGYNWSTLPVLYDGPSMASYWVDQAGYWGMGRWNNLTQSSNFYWGAEAGYADFELEPCQPYYMYLPDTACTSNDDCADDKFCYFVDAATCGDVAAGICKPRPPGCEYAPQVEVCGCDGITYPSVCEAEQSGASVASDGACDPCADDPCVNGTCTPDDGRSIGGDGNGNDGNGSGNGGGNDGGIVCECEPGYSGIFCETPNEPDASNVPGDGAVPVCVEEDLGSAVPRTIGGNFGGQSDNNPGTCGAGGGVDRTYWFTAPDTGLYQFDTLGSLGVDTMLGLYDGCGGGEVACSDDVGLWTDEQSAVIVRHLVAGQSVVLVVDGYEDGLLEANYTLNINAVQGYDCEANNPCTPENLDAGNYAFESTISSMYIRCIDGGVGEHLCERVNCDDYEQEWGSVGEICQ